MSDRWGDRFQAFFEGGAMGLLAAVAFISVATLLEAVGVVHQLHLAEPWGVMFGGAVVRTIDRWNGSRGQ